MEIHKNQQQHEDEEIRDLITQEMKKVDLLIFSQSKRIGYINLWCKGWKEDVTETQKKIIDRLFDVFYGSIKNKDVYPVSLGFIHAPIDCSDQFFHFDYFCKTETIFIPLIDIDDKNGTEYVEFRNMSDNLKYMEFLLHNCSDKYILKEDLITFFKDYNIDNYDIKQVCCSAFDFLKMPYYLLHRGVKNKGNCDRIMFQLVVSFDNEFVLTNQDIYVPDSELDDCNDKENVIEQRMNML